MMTGTIQKIRRFFARKEGEFQMGFVGALPLCKVRLLQPEDIAQCEQIYLLNEPLHFPAGFYPMFAQWLRDGKVLIVVIEQDNAVVAVGGMTADPVEGQQFVTLSFGMVHPAHQQKGLGTLLLLSRMALLRQNATPAQVHITTVGGSETFYGRFGFAYQDSQQATPDYLRKYYAVKLSTADIDKCAFVLGHYTWIHPDFYTTRLPGYHGTGYSSA
ncbi:GNAT family N-acetyltransferase [Acidovorax sp. LjRoot117]|uniref:GNAT family N-acetyltransferase n=1 Tax=Acidovorax sp. LjRoot117 TaxID=3342255 RepID=UPI003ECE1157